MNEKEFNTAIYNKLADIAREVFKHVICEPGTYSAADVAKHIHTTETFERVRKVRADGEVINVNEPRFARSFINGFYWAEDYDPAKDTHTVDVEGFSCKVNGWGVFLVLQKAATAWAIPTAARPVFSRKAETADAAAADSIAATFAVNKELRDLAAIADPRETLRPVYSLICIDTRRRAAVACNGATLRVVALPDLLTAPDAADSYLIAPALLKSGRGRVTITADGYASNGATVAPLGEGRFPDWAGLVSSTLSNYNYSEAARVELSRPTFNALKKTVKAAAKLSERVTIAAKSYDTAATVYAHDRDHDRDHESRAELAAPVRSSFSVVLRADQFAKLSDVTAFYFVRTAAPVLAAASLGFYYFNPLLAEDGEKFYTPFNIAPDGAMYDPMADFAEVAAPAADLTADTDEPTPAAADNIESETPAAPAADLTAESEAETIEADPLPLLSIDTDAGVIVWGLADELPTADGQTADTATPADLLTIEAEHADSQTADTDRAERRPLLLTIARHALRLAAAAALLLLLTIAPDRTADTLADELPTAAPAADSIEAGTITAADLLTADSEAESRAELAAPADSPRPVAERRHAPANKRESHARALLTVATADSIAAPLLTIEADTLTADTLTAAAPAADSIEADTLAAGSTLETPREITDAPTADTDSEADTITPDDEPTDDTDPATADSQADSTDTPTAAAPAAGCPAAAAVPCSPSAPLAPVAPILI